MPPKKTNNSKTLKVDLKATKSEQKAQELNAVLKVNDPEAANTTDNNTIIDPNSAKRDVPAKLEPDPSPTKFPCLTQNSDPSNTGNLPVSKPKGAAVDELVPNRQNYIVFQEGEKTYSAILNQSNLDANNNKFYIIQILKLKSSGELFFWNRYGRVGVPGQNNIKGPMTSAAAIKQYEAKYKDKAIKGDYKQLQIKYDQQDDKKDANEQISYQVVKKTPKTGTSKLDKRLQAFINLIFDPSIMNKTMQQIGYNPKKMPLGKLGDSTIKEAYSILNNLLEAIKNNDHSKIKSLSGDFYTLIPHDFGFKKMIEFILDDENKVKTKLAMLQTISDMKITTKLLQDQNQEEDIIDQNYKKLGCSIAPIDRDSQQFKIIQQYFNNTKESWNIEIEDVFGIHRQSEHQRFRKQLGNNMLLWHGSRIANFVGILSQGLRIAPPEAPVSGYLFGKGIYLADMIDKSAHYCRSWGSETALCLLVEGAIGDPNILVGTNSGAKNQMQKNGKNSTKCHGSKAPPVSSYVKLDEMLVPKGKPEPTNSGSYMGHNQYIVYDVSQARIRYVVKMKMK